MTVTPPRLARRLLRALLPAEWREFVVGDLDEGFASYVLAQRGARGAARWYWAQALRTVTQFRPPPTSGLIPAPGGAALGALGQDLRFAARNLRHTPGFSLLAILTLALGIGAATTIFTTMNDVMVRPLPFRDPDRLMMLWEKNAERGWVMAEVAPANWLDWREGVAGFEDIAMVSHWVSGVALEQPDGSGTEIQVGYASGNFFSVLGVSPLLGRSFTFEEAWDQTAPGVVLSHATWRRLYGEDPDIVGRSVRLDGKSYRVTGVLPADFRFDMTSAEAWIPFWWTLDNRSEAWFRRAHLARAVGRLSQGVTAQQARQQLDAVAARLQVEYPELNRAMEADFEPLHDFLVGDRRTTLFILFGAVGLLLLIACSNVANLMLVRTAGRRRELAVRAALGAPRARLLRQMVTESFVLAAGAAVLGAVLGTLGVRGVAALRPEDLGGVGVHLDWRMFAFALGMTALVAALAGAGPAWRAMRQHPRDALSEGGRTGTMGRRATRLSNTLAVAQIALALVMVAGAGLMVRTIRALRAIDPGFSSHNVLTFAILPPSGSYGQDRVRADLVERFLERVAALPGVVHAGAARGLPLTQSGWTSDFAIEGRDREAFGIELRHNNATPGYFAALGIPLLQGGMMAERLAPGAPVPILINQAMADRVFPNEDPIGRRLANDRYPDENSFWYTIVGVVGNTRRVLTEAPDIEITNHLRADTPGIPSFVVKASVDPLSLVPMIRQVMKEIDAGVPVVSVRTMEEVVAASLARERFMLILLSLFAGLALLLAAVGVYGVTSQVARGQVREIGIRMALGAPSGLILRQVLLARLQYVVAGVALGVAGTFVGARLLRGFLFGVAHWDPPTLAGVALLLALVALATSYPPAVRASRTEPAGVLKGD